ncbi:sulfatase-like hydrolase/transferase [Myxococcota bacterium]|nr:sulfatase-like hydrolase/transferase [Myxococcota bacterium]
MMILLSIVTVAITALLTAKFIPEPWRGRILNVLKAGVTVGAFWLLFSHPVTDEDGNKVVAGRLVLDTLARIDAGTFWTFVGLAAGIKFVGILASMYRWTILLRGQSIELPFWHIFGSFLIGRFIGTFLPSTAGLDGYKLYDAARFSGRSVEVTATTALEKVIGFSGIFLSFLVALPFGIGIFGDNAGLIAGITVPVCLALIGGLLVVLWYPGLIEWLLGALPIPGRDRLEGLVMRISRSAAAYRDKRGLVALAFLLSFIVHFSTAAMYYFTALAIGATTAEFWPIAFGSSIQILATVLSPFTIAGEGIREAAQYVLLGNLLGPGNAIVSAALGFWAAEALTLAGAFFWWFRPKNYTPAYCLVEGQQVDYEQAAEAARQLMEDTDGPERNRAALPPLAARVKLSAGLGLGAGALSGIVIGGLEALLIASGGGEEMQVLWYGPLAYAFLLGGIGASGGVLLALLPADLDELRGWTPALASLATFLPFSLAIVLFRLRRDVYLEQMPPAGVLAAVLGTAALLAVVLFFFGPKWFRAPGINRLFRPLTVGVALLGVTLAGATASLLLGPGSGSGASAPPVPSSLAKRPNLILVMVDTLRADHLSCYGASDVRTPEICSLVEAGGTLFDGYSHASWTKPATASILTSLVPSTHGAMSKPSALPDAVTFVSEVLSDAGYRTGGIVSNINLAPSFGFDQGYDEYSYLAPDYLLGAEETSSKLILYNIWRAVWFKVKSGYSVGDFYQNAEVINELGFDFLARHRDSRFFLFLHYMDPHDPYFEHPYDGDAVARVSNQHPDPELAERMRRLYVEEIEYLDAQFGVLLDELRRLGLYDDTVIVLTADHGEEFFEHGGWWHGTTLYEEQIRVPLLVKWSKGGDSLAVGRDERGQVARLIDIAPTLIARAGVSKPAAMQGLDLGLGLDGRAETDALAFAEEDHEGNVLRAIRSSEWKYIEANEDNPRGVPSRELFHVARDPGESANQFEARPDIASGLRGHVEAQEQLAKSQSIDGGGEAQLSAADEDALRQLGYIE